MTVPYTNVKLTIGYKIDMYINQPLHKTHEQLIHVRNPEQDSTFVSIMQENIDFGGNVLAATCKNNINNYSRIMPSNPCRTFLLY